MRVLHQITLNKKGPAKTVMNRYVAQLIQDIEFIIDPNAPAIPPSRSVTYAPTPVPIRSPNKAANVEPTPPSTEPDIAKKDLDETPHPPTTADKPAQPAVVLASVAPTPTPEPSLADLPPEGPPPPAGITAPELNLSPSASALQYPPKEPIYEESDDQATALNIYQVDVDSLPEKPWRRPGANLSDWFNYGFDESTWAMWCAQKNRMSQTRADFSSILKDGPDENNTKDPYVPTESDNAQNPMANLTAMFAPGMMGMPGMPGMQWPMMMPGAQEGPPSEAIPPMGRPPVENESNAQWPAATHPLPQPPNFASADHPRNAESEGREGGHGRSRRHGRDGRGSSRSGNASRRSGRSGRNDDRSPPHVSAEADFAPDQPPTVSRRDRYNDRDNTIGSGDLLDYGASAQLDDERRHRRQTTPRHEDHRREDDRHQDEPTRSSRDRPSRRERDRARSERRAGRGGQKRGAPDGEEHDYASKRFNGGR